MKHRAARRHTHLQLDHAKLTRATTVLGTKAETEAIERALALVVEEHTLDQPVEAGEGTHAAAESLLAKCGASFLTPPSPSIGVTLVRMPPKIGPVGTTCSEPFRNVVGCSSRLPFGLPRRSATI